MTLYIKSQVFLNSKAPKIRNVKDLFKESKSKKPTCYEGSSYLLQISWEKIKIKFC